VEQVLPIVESKFHKILAWEYITCATRRRLVENSTIVSSLSSLAKDTVDASTACTAEQQKNGSACYIIAGGETFAFLDSQPTKDELYSSVGAFLGNNQTLAPIPRDISGVTGISFLGFTNVNDGVTPENPAAAAQQTTTSVPPSPALIGGSVAIAVAAVMGALILGAIYVRRKNKDRHSVYLKQQDREEDVYSLDAPTEESVQRNAVVWNDSDDADSAVDVWHEDDHNPKTCVSTTCQKCLDIRLQQPTFIKAELLQEEIQRDLGPVRTRDNPREYYAPNTVDL